MYIVILSSSQLSCSQGLKLLPAKSSTRNLCFILLQFTTYYASCSPFNNENILAFFLILKDNRQFFFFPTELCCLWRKAFIHGLMCRSYQCYHQLKA